MNECLRQCRFIRDDAVEAEALRKAENIAEAERKRVAASIRGSLTKQVGLCCAVLSTGASGSCVSCNAAQCDSSM